MATQHSTLLITQGANRGTRYELEGTGIIGRGVGCRIRLDDVEVSRQHARLESTKSGGYLIRDLKSANGTIVNGRRVSSVELRNGDLVRVGATAMTYQSHAETSSVDQLIEQVLLIDDADGSVATEDIVRQVDEAEAREVSMLTVADTGTLPSQQAIAGLDLLFRVSAQLVRPTHTVESLLQKLLQLTLEAVGADRGCVLLTGTGADDSLRPLAYSGSVSGDQMPISRSITDHVLQTRRAVRTADARHDLRFQLGNSIVSSGIREAICAPMRGQDEMLGVFYIDTTMPTRDGDDASKTASGDTLNRLTDDHLRLVLTVARQAAQAIEARQYHDALVKAERLAATGQTIAMLSHHIKNILQGLQGGGYLIRTGLQNENNESVQQGWQIVERNQQRIYDLVTDMLSFSKERVPVLVPGVLNETIDEVVELVTGRANQLGVNIVYEPGEQLPMASFDKEAIHRAVLNVALNAVDAVDGESRGTVVIQTGYDQSTRSMLIAISDNGPGIPTDQLERVFSAFESSKGYRGTGLGLAVSRKMLREHGGDITVESQPGKGSRFVLSLPRGHQPSDQPRTADV